MSSLRARYDPDHPHAGTELPHLRYTRFIRKWILCVLLLIELHKESGEARELINSGRESQGITFTPDEMYKLDAFVDVFMESYVDRT